jgi:hypothetical protein
MSLLSDCVKLQYPVSFLDVSAPRLPWFVPELKIWFYFYNTMSPWESFLYSLLYIKAGGTCFVFSICYLGLWFPGKKGEEITLILLREGGTH